MFSKKTAPVVAENTAPFGVLSNGDFNTMTVQKIETISHDTKIYTFFYDNKGPINHTALPCTSYVLCRALINDKVVVRPYTPVDVQPGVLSLVVKSYPTGTLSKHIGELRVGDKIDIKGPMKKYNYVPNATQNVTLIAGGTGITPCFQVLSEIINNPHDKTNVTLLYGNKTADDIIMKRELDAIVASHPKRVNVVHILNEKNPIANETGFITSSVISKYVKNESNMVFVCGPPPMMVSVSGSKNLKDYSQGELAGALKELGYNESNVYKF